MTSPRIDSTVLLSRFRITHRPESPALLSLRQQHDREDNRHGEHGQRDSEPDRPARQSDRFRAW